MAAPLYCIVFLLFQGPMDAGAVDYYEAGVQNLIERQTREAVLNFELCLEEDPDCVMCLWELGWAHVLEGNWEQVVECWEKVKSLEPDHPELKLHLSRAYEQRDFIREVTRFPVDSPFPQPDRCRSSIRICSAGDVMMGTTYPKERLPMGDGAGYFDGIRDWLADGDITLVNLEGPLCPGGESSKCEGKEQCFAFRTPPHYGHYLADAGINMVSLANNHIRDFGEGCREETESILEFLGIGWSGRPGTVAVRRIHDVSVAMVAFHAHPYFNNLLDPEVSTAFVQTLSRQYDILIVSMHGGAEGESAIHVPDEMETYLDEDRGHVRDFAHRMVEAGADLVVGHGPHVLRGLEIYRGRLIAYSLGNFATFGQFNLTGNLGIGAILCTDLDGTGAFISGTLLPTRQEGWGIPVSDPEGRAVDLVRYLSKTDFPETAPRISDDGAVIP